MKHILIIFILSLASTSWSQDPHFTHYRNSEWYINPAWAGSDSVDYVALKHRNQWPNLSGRYLTTTVVYSHSFTNIKGNIFASFLNDNAGRGTLMTNRLSLAYTHRFDLGDFKIRPGVQFTYQQKAVDWSKLTFGDQIDPRRGFVYETGQIPNGGSKSSFDISAGIVSSYKNLVLGVSLHHVNEPDESLIAGNSPLPMKIGAQLMYRYALGSKWLITPSYFFENQGSFDNSFSSINHTIGMNICHKWLEIGAGIRNRDAQLYQVGFKFDLIEFYYSYDQTISKLQSSTGGSHELSLRVYFLDKRVKKSAYILPAATELF